MDTDRPDTSLDLDLLRQQHRALTATKEELFHLVDATSPAVLRALLKNPHLDENHLLQLLNRRDLSEELLRTVYKLPQVEESHPLKVALVKNPATPPPLVLTLLPHLYLFELVTVCYLPGVTADQKLAAERAIIQRLPGVPLGSKITLARRATATVVEAILQEGVPALIEICLANPHLKEAALFRFLNGPKATAETISAVARHPRWKSRPNLRLALLRNRSTPLVWFALFLPGLPRVELRNLLGSQKLSPAQRQAVSEELKRRGGG